MAKPVFYGGQAVIEGVMMRGPRNAAIAVRREDGRIETMVRPIRPWLAEHPALDKPFLRGAFALIDAMRLGVWAMRWSASRAMLDAQPSASEEAPAQGDPTVKGTMAIGILIGVGLFIALPTLLSGAIPRAGGSVGRNLIETAVRFALFFAYLGAIGLMGGIRRVFQYHGAEHRTINAWEAGCELKPGAIGRFSVIHPRCGTSFIMFVLILASVAYAFLGWHAPLVRMAIRIAILPVVAGISYELLRLAGTLRGSVAMAVLTWPGRFTQKLTTREPDEAQTEVAIAALNAVFQAEREEERALA